MPIAGSHIPEKAPDKLILGGHCTLGSNGVRIDGWMKALEEASPDLVIIDSMMLGMYGLELLRNLREEGFRVVIDPHPVDDLAAWAAYGEEGKVLMRVAAELMIGVGHLAPPMH